MYREDEATDQPGSPALERMSPEERHAWAQHPKAVMPCHPLSPRQVMDRLHRQGLHLHLTGEMLRVGGGCAGPILQGQILANLRGLLEVVAHETGRLQPARAITFERERRCDS